MPGDDARSFCAGLYRLLPRHFGDKLRRSWLGVLYIFPFGRIYGMFLQYVFETAYSQYIGERSGQTACKAALK